MSEFRLSNTQQLTIAKCSNSCGMDIGVKNGNVVGVRGRIQDRVNKGRLGPKGLHGSVVLEIPPPYWRRKLMLEDGCLSTPKIDCTIPLFVRMANLNVLRGMKP